MGPRSHERGNLRGILGLDGEDQRVVASMGPRSHERGNGNDGRGSSWQLGRAALQWGRVLMNAETRLAAPTADVDCRHLRFNGAAFS